MSATRTLLKSFKKFSNEEAVLKMHLCIFLAIFAVAQSSSILVQDGVYSRVTVQISDQRQPENCVQFLDHLEVRFF